MLKVRDEVQVVDEWNPHLVVHDERYAPGLRPVDLDVFANLKLTNIVQLEAGLLHYDSIRGAPLHRC